MRKKKQNFTRSAAYALFWKEWRESWWLLGVLFLAPVVMQVDEFWVIVPLVFAALSGARPFAAEAANQTAFFQQRLPCRQSIIWLTKVLPPLLVITAGWLLFLVPAVSRGEFTFWMNISLFLIWNAFAIACICSILLDQPVTALAASLVLFVLILALELTVAQFVRDRLNASPYWTSAFIDSASAQGTIVALFLLLQFACLLLISRWLFSRS